MVFLTTASRKFDKKRAVINDYCPIRFRERLHNQNGSIGLFQALDESLNLELEGTNPSPIAINGSIVDAGQPVKFVLVNRNAFENGKSQVKVMGVGMNRTIRWCYSFRQSESYPGRFRKRQSILRWKTLRTCLPSPKSPTSL